MSSLSEPYLFILHDAGESYMALPVLQQLNSEGYDVDVLALGEPASTIYAPYHINKRQPHRASSGGLVSYTLADLGVNVVVVDGNVTRAQLLNTSDVETVVQFFNPRPVVGVGMVYAMQSQLSRAFRHSSSYIVGLDDSFALWNSKSLTSRLFVAPPIQTRMTTPAVVDEIFVTATSVATGAMEASGGIVSAFVTGSPTLDEWADDAANETEIAAARSFILEQAGRTTSGHGSSGGDEALIFIYAGGYGGDEYVASLETFCGAATALVHDVGGEQGGNESVSPWIFVFSPHPGYDSVYEAALFSSWGCSNDTILVANNGNSSDAGSPGWNAFDTGQLVVASNGSLSEASTVGGQSLSVTKPHVYTSPTYADVFTEAGLIPQTGNDVEALVSILNNTFRDQDFTIPQTAMYAAGVPPNGTAIMATRLRELVVTSDPSPFPSCGDCWCVPDNEGTDPCPDDEPQSTFSNATIYAYAQKLPDDFYRLECNPYADEKCLETIPPQEYLEFGDDAVCAFIYDETSDGSLEDSSSCSTYILKTFSSNEAFESDPIASQRGAVTHAGSCGLCSTARDLAVYLSEDFTTAGKHCAAVGLFNETQGQHCYEALGLTPECAKIWNYDGIYDGKECITPCAMSLTDPNNGPPPTCPLNPCLECDELEAGPIFSSFAGRTRRRSGLLSEIVRNCSSIASGIVHDAACPQD